MEDPSKTKPETKAEAKSATAPLFAGLLDGAGIATAQAVGSAVNGCVTQYGEKFQSFLTNRLNEDTQFQQDVLACRDLQRLATLQSEFLMTALDQYSEHTRQLVDIGSTALEQMMRPNGEAVAQPVKAGSH